MCVYWVPKRKKSRLQVVPTRSQTYEESGLHLSLHVMSDTQMSDWRSDRLLLIGSRHSVTAAQCPLSKEQGGTAFWPPRIWLG